MATVYAANSGYAYRYTSGGWASIRDGTTGTNYNDDPSTGAYLNAVGVFHTSGRGGDTYGVWRSFYYFDTSGITGTLTEATLKIYGKSNSAADVIVVKSDAYGGDGGTALVADDFNNLDFSTAYSAELATWSTSGYNDLALNSTALADIKNNDAFIVCLIEHDHDYSDTAPSSADLKNGAYYDNHSGTSKDPYIDYTVSTGYGNAVLGVASANIGKITAVATADIEKVIGV